MAFWNKDKKDGAASQVEIGRNDPCHCGSGKKYKKCCIEKDQTAEHKVLEENFKKAAAEAKDQAEKSEKENPSASTKHANNPKAAQPKHQSFVPSQVSTPRKSGGG